jgi:hypothetical protein
LSNSVRGGRTPAIRVARPSIGTMAPTMSDEAPNARRQNPSLSTAAVGPPGRSSSGMKKRPAAAAGLRVSNTEAETNAADARSVSARAGR